MDQGFGGIRETGQDGFDLGQILRRAPGSRVPKRPDS